MKKKRVMFFVMLVISSLLIITSCSDDSTGPNDTTAPEVQLTYPTNYLVLPQAEEILITAEATDNDAVNKVIFYIDGHQQCEDTSSPYSYSWNTIDLSGTITLYVKAIDLSDNETNSDIISVTIQPPSGFVFVVGGTFQMGDRFNEGYIGELPLHDVTLSSFYMGATEVTQSEYEAVMGNNPATGYGVGDNYPVYHVSWYDAVAYCNAKSIAEGFTPCYSGSGGNTTCDWNANGYRLPTEAEWEYAARGGIHEGDNYKYSGTNDNLVDYIWFYANNSTNETKAVGTKLPNQLGLYDMSGNLYEWCWDWYSSSYYSFSPSSNPHGADSGSLRIRRGGYWGSNASFCRVSGRNWGYPDGSVYHIGFRLLRANP